MNRKRLPQKMLRAPFLRLFSGARAGNDEPQPEPRSSGTKGDPNVFQFGGGESKACPECSWLVGAAEGDENRQGMIFESEGDENRQGMIFERAKSNGDLRLFLY
jgi:hypothetical protein